MDERCPICNRPWLTRRGDAMADAVRHGRTLEDVASEFGVSHTAVHKACRARNVKPRGTPGRKRKTVSNSH